MPRLEGAEKKPLAKILIVGVTELEGAGDGGIAKESANMKLKGNVWVKSSALSGEETPTEPPG